jgi:hypothetical protein
MFNQNIISIKFDLNWSTTFSYRKLILVIINIENDKVYFSLSSPFSTLQIPCNNFWVKKLERFSNDACSVYHCKTRQGYFGATSIVK